MKTSSGKKKVSKTTTKRKASTKAAQSKNNISSGALQRRVEEKAYELFTRRGHAHGGDALDWALAQDLIELERKAASSKKLRKAVKSRDLDEEIEKRAYELFEYRGHIHGNDFFDWSLAQEIAFLKNNIS